MDLAALPEPSKTAPDLLVSCKKKMAALIQAETSGVFRECDFWSIIPPGVPFLIAMTINQTDDRVTAGTVTVGSAGGTIAAATIGEDGVVQLSGAMTSFPDNPTRVNLENMRLESTTAGTIRGDYVQVWTSVGSAGSGRLTARLDSMGRESGGPTLNFGIPRNSRTLQDLVRMMMVAR